MDKVVVSIADEKLDDLARVVAALRHAGLVVEAVQDALGTVTGSVAPGAIESLRAVPGVLDVERQRDYHLPPPDGGVQ